MIFGPDGGVVAASQVEHIRDEMVVATLDAALLARERASELPAEDPAARALRRASARPSTLVAAPSWSVRGPTDRASRSSPSHSAAREAGII